MNVILFFKTKPCQLNDINGILVGNTFLNPDQLSPEHFGSFLLSVNYSDRNRNILYCFNSLFNKITCNIFICIPLIVQWNTTYIYVYYMRQNKILYYIIYYIYLLSAQRLHNIYNKIYINNNILKYNNTKFCFHKTLTR